MKARYLLVLALLSTGCVKRFTLTAPESPKALLAVQYSVAEYTSDEAFYEVSASGEKPDLVKAKIIRDKIVYNLISEIDNSYGLYANQLFLGRGTTAVAKDSAIIGLTTAATILTPPATKTIMSALATGLTGIGLSYDKNFFAQQTYQVIASAMQNRRDKARNSIVISLADGVDVYSLAQAKRDLTAYFYAGTLPGGLQELQEQTGVSSMKLQQAIH